MCRWDFSLVSQWIVLARISFFLLVVNSCLGVLFWIVAVALKHGFDDFVVWRHAFFLLNRCVEKVVWFCVGMWFFLGMVFVWDWSCFSVFEVSWCGNRVFELVCFVIMWISEMASLLWWILFEIMAVHNFVKWFPCLLRKNVSVFHRISMGNCSRSLIGRFFDWCSCYLHIDKIFIEFNVELISNENNFSRHCWLWSVSLTRLNEYEQIKKSAYLRVRSFRVERISGLLKDRSSVQSSSTTTSLYWRMRNIHFITEISDGID